MDNMERMPPPDTVLLKCNLFQFFCKHSCCCTTLRGKSSCPSLLFLAPRQLWLMEASHTSACASLTNMICCHAMCNTIRCYAMCNNELGRCWKHSPPSPTQPCTAQRGPLMPPFLPGLEQYASKVAGRQTCCPLCWHSLLLHCCRPRLRCCHCLY